jgi:hypothetical protein
LGNAAHLEPIGCARGGQLLDPRSLINAACIQWVVPVDHQAGAELVEIALRRAQRGYHRVVRVGE